MPPKPLQTGTRTTSGTVAETRTVKTPRHAPTFPSPPHAWDVDGILEDRTRAPFRLKRPVPTLRDAVSAGGCAPQQ